MNLQGLHNADLILGPPGTGKTTELIRIVLDALGDGVAPERIGYMAFTRKAAHEATVRARERLGLNAEEGASKFPWFRTLHSAAFRSCGLTMDNVMTREDYLALGKDFGTSFTFSSLFRSSWDMASQMSSGVTKGDRLLFIDSMARGTGRGIVWAWEHYGEPVVDWRSAKRFHDAYSEYRKARGVVDFTDMIEGWVARGPWPALELLIVDEAQDLSNLQWRAVSELALNSGARRVVLAGDDDQAIFEWSGADVDTFRNLPVKSSMVLSHSYRLPSRLWRVAEHVSSQIAERYPKEWKPRGKGGIVEHVYAPNYPAMSEGSWMILARNRFLLDDVVRGLRDYGYAYKFPGEARAGREIGALRAWRLLQDGDQLTPEQAEGLFDGIRCGERLKRGAKQALSNAVSSGVEAFGYDDLKTLGLRVRLNVGWKDVLTGIGRDNHEYFDRVLERGEDPANPRITISTIHGVKGGEADNVLLMLDMSRETWKGWEREAAPEHRVWYVGVTRARERLFIMGPLLKEFYEPLWRKESLV